MEDEAPGPPDASPTTGSSISEDDLFEPVSLRDLDRTIGSGRYDPRSPLGRDDLTRSPGAESAFFSAAVELDRALAAEMSASPAAAHPPSSTASFESFASPIASPPRLRPKLVPPTIAPELVHLVDSAIMGVGESVDRLRSMVTSGDSVDDVSLSVVDALLVTMGGIDGFDDISSGREAEGTPCLMHSSRAAVVAAELIPWLPWQGDLEHWMSPRTRMVNGLLHILRACTRNRAMCSSSGLLGVLLNCAEKILVDSTDRIAWDGTPLCQCIQVLAGHSLSVADLHRWLGVIKKTLTTDWAIHLTIALERAMAGTEARGPACTFEFDGESSGLLGPGEARWSFSNGYGFATWVYIESFADTLNTATAAAAIAAAAAARSGKSSPVSAAAAASALAGEGTTHMPRLFSFLSPENLGVEAYFHGQFLVVECGSAKGKKASLHFTHVFKPRTWYFVGLEHTCKQGLIGKAESELKLYIDGSLYESRPFEFPRISKSLAFCCIGTNPPPTMAGLQRKRRQCPLFAEMGPIYIFREPIGPDRMGRLAARGGDALPSFGSGAGLPWKGVNAQMKSLAEESFALDAEIGVSLHLLYHPKLLSGRFCPDASPCGAAGTHRRPAEVLGQVHIASRIRASESLWALAYGGPMALLPLTVSNVQKESLEPVIGDFSLSLATASLSAPIFRIISKAIEHIGNNDELCRMQGPEVLSHILHYLLQTISVLDLGKKTGLSDEELVNAIISLCQSQKENHALKVKLFTTLLLDLKIWSLCNYGLQKKLLSSLADMVFTESSAMRDANALQMLLDGCRRCYWVIREKDSVNTFSIHDTERPVGEVNALVDELLVVIELLIGAASPSIAIEDLHRLIGFLVDCPQPNQAARVLHLIYRLVVQPNSSRAHLFAESFISSGGIETLLVLLQREAKLGNHNVLEHSISKILEHAQDAKVEVSIDGKAQGEDTQSLEHLSHEESSLKSFQGDAISTKESLLAKIERMHSPTENQLLRNLGGITLSISADSARNNVYNVDRGDGIVIGIINLLGALVTSGHLKLGSQVSNSNFSSSFHGTNLIDDGSTMFSDKIALLLFSLQKAFQAAPRRLMTTNVYMALLGASMNVSSTDDGLNLYDSGHRFEHSQLLLVLLRSLPYASRTFQVRAIQDLLFLACSHSENRINLTYMEEWPEWILEVLISNYEMGSNRYSNGPRIGDIEDLIHNFLIIVLEHSMRQKDGWKDVEATIHCAEWLSMVGGSSTGDLRIRREESLPIFKRRLLGGLLDFAARELQVQTQVIAAAAAGVAAEGLSPQEAKIEAENAALLSMALAENAIVILMLVEDHLRLQSQVYLSTHPGDCTGSPSSLTPASFSRSNSIGRNTGTSDMSKRSSTASDSGGLPLDVLASMADANGQISAVVMERLTAAAAAEPYESVRCAFVSYGSCGADLAEGWKSRTRMWYGVGIPSKDTVFGGGGSGWDSWKSVLEKDSSGNWIELPLVKKSVAVLQALLLDESGLGGGLGIGGGSGTGMGGMTALYQLLDSDQPFLCMLRMVLVSMREDDNGDDDIFMRNISIKEGISEGLHWQVGGTTPLDNHARLPTRKPRSALLWSVLAPILNMPISESKRQRVLVASCVLYSEVWHAVGRDRKPLRKQYVEMVLPPFVAILRRWRPLLAGIHELTSSDGQNPLVVDDRALAADALPLEAALSMISPGWAAAFASPPAAMALAMIAAGTAGGETAPPPRNTPFRRDSSWRETRNARLHTFSSFPKPPEPAKSAASIPKDKAAAKAAALAAARDLERLAKIGTGRGLSAVAMATSGQRRSASDMDRAKRWNISEAMGTAWTECLQSVDTKSVSGKDFSALSYKYVAVLVASFALARNMQRLEIDRRAHVNVIDRHCASIGIRTWRKLIHYLMEMNVLFAPFTEQCNPQRILWKLNSMESSSRMRLCFKKNYKGSNHMGAAADQTDVCIDSKSEEASVCVINDTENPFNTNIPSTASILTEEAISLEGQNEDYEPMEIDSGSDSIENMQNRLSSTDMSSIQGLVGRSSFDDSADHFLLQSAAVVAPGYVPSESDERIFLELSSSIVQPLKVVKGTFQVTSRRINFIVDEHHGETYADGVTSSRKYPEQKKDRSWLMSSLHQIFSRRYLLRKSALELFMVDRSNFFFDFGTIEGRKIAYRAIVQARPPHLNNIYLATQRPDQLFKRAQLMERWSRWEISNFEYLMELNTLAGRSYNDITQYPVFPWILADYESTSLNLGDPSTFRDLSKPIGALNADRLQKFQERYSSFEDPVIPKFHYGSHYSSAGIVLYYLVRVEPYTTLSIQLQGGQFDHADRMFSDMGATWNGVLEDMSDVKELVPELFYLPEILTNGNSINFGTTQLGERLDSVKLPPWADSPVDFIHKHRMALESEHVSAHLHEWIDLIFGYKQRGKEAIAANNMFFYITYEGTVDIDKISDPVQQRATQDQIAYFGQTPSQLLSSPHIRKRPLADILHLQTVFRNPKEIKPYNVSNPERCNVPATAMLATQDSIVVVDMSAPAATVASHKWQPNTPDGQGTPFLFQHGKNAASSAGGAFIRMFKGPGGPGNEEWQFPRALAFPASGIRSSGIVAFTSGKEIVTGGHADNTIKLISSDGAKTIESASGHCAPVTCLALSPDSSYLATGSRDATVILWKIHHFTQSRSHAIPDTLAEPVTAPGSPLKVSYGLPYLLDNRRRHIEGPMQVLRGHLGEIVCCSIRFDLGVVASSSYSSGVLMHSIRRGRLIRRVDVREADSICLSPQGVLITWSKSELELCTFTLNGIPISKAHVSPFSGRISCLEISLDGQSVLIGTSSSSSDKTGDRQPVNETPHFYDKDENNDEQNPTSATRNQLTFHVPSICFLNLHDLKLFHTVKLEEGQDVSAVALNKDHTNLIVSTADKQLIVFTDPKLSLKEVDQMLRLGWEGDGLSPLMK